MAESGERAVGWAVPELGSADGRPLEASPLDTYDGVLLVYRTAEPVAEFYSTAVFYLQNCIFESGADGTRTHALRRAKSRNCLANPLPTLGVAPQGVGVELFATFRLRTLAKLWR